MEYDREEQTKRIIKRVEQLIQNTAEEMKLDRKEISVLKTLNNVIQDFAGHIIVSATESLRSHYAKKTPEVPAFVGDAAQYRSVLFAEASARILSESLRAQIDYVTACFDPPKEADTSPTFALRISLEDGKKLDNVLWELLRVPGAASVGLTNETFVQFHSALSNWCVRNS